VQAKTYKRSHYKVKPFKRMRMINMAFGFPGYIEVLMIATGLSLASVLISKYLGNQKGVKNLKAEMKSLNASIKKAQKAGDTKEMNRLSGNLMKLSSKQFQLNMKPMMFSMMLFFGMFAFFGTYYAELVIPAPFSIPFIGNSMGWFHWYLMIVLPGSFLFRKLLSVE
jgi:uncharacterized membrane protein (DUF106 family)